MKKYIIIAVNIEIIKQVALWQLGLIGNEMQLIGGILTLNNCARPPFVYYMTWITRLCTTHWDGLITSAHFLAANFSEADI